MRREPDFFGEQELVLIYVARRLKEALSVEKAFNATGIDYTVVPTRYMGGVLFRSQRVGAFFYVAPLSAGPARGSLLRHGFTPVEDSALEGEPN